MDIPQPPEDEETRNIIDRLANFVARNGSGFEEMTKQKQRGNPRFEFLFGGQYYNYYTYRVTTEQAILKQQAMRQQQALSHGQGHPQFQHQFGPGPHVQGPPGLLQGHGHTRDTSGQGQFPPGSVPAHFQQHGFVPGPRPQFQNQGTQPQGQNPFITAATPAQRPQSRFTSGPPTPNQFQGGGGLPQRQFQPSLPLAQASQFQTSGPQFSTGPPPQAAPSPSQFTAAGPLAQIPGPFPPSPSSRLQAPVPVQPPPPPPRPPTQNLDILLNQKKTLEESIVQSEQNLRSQHQVLLAQQSTQVDEALRQATDQEIQALASEVGISPNELRDFEHLLLQVMETCTKDAIANGKAWIFTHTSTRKHYELISSYLVRKVTEPGLSFTQRLHLIYLVNDTVHHCQRKGATDLQQVLEQDAIVPMFAYTKVLEENSTNPNLAENLGKLDKLLSLWESKPGSIRAEALAQLRNVQATWTAFRNAQFARYSGIINSIASSVQKTFEGFQTQHTVFLHHISESIKGIERQIAEIQDQTQQEEILRQIQQDLSRPPPLPAIPPPPIVLEVPKLPYYELPAGLMVPLIKPEDDNYKPLDPADIRLPAPCPPSERLISAIEAFYGPPSHDNPRDAEGWERLGLYEYYKQKNKARKDKEDDIREGRREKSKSPSPVQREDSPSGRDGVRRRYSSTSPSPPRDREKDRDRDTSSRRRGGRSRSRSPSSRRSRRRSRGSRSPSPVSTTRRSPTPPSFGSRSGLGHEPRLDESNKGHQLLKKMGWGGSGLGAKEQGIDAPISGGHIRDRTDQYKGVGVDLKDPFELYRKSKGYAFIERMRSRGGEEGRP